MTNNKDIEKLRSAINARFPELMELQEKATIQCLDLTLRREYAEQIAAGTKKVEYRWPIPFWNNKLQNTEIERILEKRKDEFFEFMEQQSISLDELSDNTLAKILPIVRRVETIHFHNFNPNGWRLDVEVKYNNFCTPDNEGREWLHSFDSYEQDEEFDEWERNGTPIEKREGYYFFVLGKILNKKGL